MSGLFGGGKKGSSSSGSYGASPTASPAPTPAPTPAASVAAPAAAPATLAVDSTSAGAQSRKRQGFLVTPTMVDDTYGSMTGRSETFG